MINLSWTEPDFRKLAEFLYNVDWVFDKEEFPIVEEWVQEMQSNPEFANNYLEGLLESDYTDAKLIKLWRAFYQVFPQYRELLKKNMFDSEGEQVDFDLVENYIRRQSNQLWPSVDTQTTELEDRTYVNPVDDIEMRRENPPNYNKRRDWYNYVDEEGEDSETSVRNDQTSLTSGAGKRFSWAPLIEPTQNYPDFPKRKLIKDLEQYGFYYEGVERKSSGKALVFVFSFDILSQIIPELHEELSNIQGLRNNYSDNFQELQRKVTGIKPLLLKARKQLNNWLNSFVREYGLIKSTIFIDPETMENGRAFLYAPDEFINKWASWRKILSDYDPAPGFIPTNRGMRTSEDIIDEASYNSYAANRDYDKDDPNYDPEKSRLRWRKFWMKHAGWTEEKLNRFEKRYIRENE